MGNKVLAVLTRGLEFDSQSPQETAYALRARACWQAGPDSSQSEGEAWLRKTPSIDFWLPHSHVRVHRPHPLPPMITVTTITITTLVEGNRTETFPGN